MKKLILFSIFLYLVNPVWAQFNWSWEELAPMPVSISNNAVTGALVSGDPFVYSFAGIDSTKTDEGISLKSFRYDVSQNSWELLPDLPDTMGKIAAGASTVDNIIYIIGGYHVFDGFPYELSSNKIHRFDPELNIYLSDGADLPYAIDDQVQAVWRDSLIYVVTGWSDIENVQHVQVYDTHNDVWHLATPVPNGVAFEAFGASGAIVGDTIFYFGGAAGSSFTGVGKLRKGVINPSNPLEIEWTDLGNNPGDQGYRSAAFELDGHVFWAGGSSVTYNYNGIAYNGSGGVSPLNRVLSYSPSTQSWSQGEGQEVALMDLRGIAQVSANEFILCGGMLENQFVSNKTYKLSYGGPNAIEEFSNAKPINLTVQLGACLSFESFTLQGEDCKIFDANGKLIQQRFIEPYRTYTTSELGLSKRGLYILSRSNSSHAAQLLVY